MSRSKRSASKRRKRGLQHPGDRIPQADESPEQRIGPARRRARVAKIVVGSGAAVVFGIWMLLARVTYAGHTKHQVRPLSIPQPLYQVVRRNLLTAGIIAPASAPPDATTSTS